LFITLEGNDHLLIRRILGSDNLPRDVVLANLGSDPELNLFIAAEIGRRKEPEQWEDVSDFHLLQALENFKRRTSGYRPSLVSVKTSKPEDDPETDK
jgi:hypothetical protein